MYTKQQRENRVYNGILLSHEKEWNIAICSNRDEPGGYPTKWSQSEKDKCHMKFHLYMKSEKWNKPMKKRKKIK